MKFLCRNLMVAILAVGCFSSTACVKLTEAQRNEVSAINSDMAALGVNLKRLAPIAEGFYARIKDVLENVARGKIPKDEGERLVALYKEQRSAAETEIKVIVQKVQELSARSDAIMDAANVPWYQELWIVGTGLLGMAVTAGIGGAKLKKAKRIVGMFSRAGNKAPGFGLLLHEEVNAEKSGVTTDDTDKVWKLAKAREI